MPRKPHRAPIPTVGGKPPGVELLEHSDSNRAGYEWSWTAWLHRRKDGRFTCSLVHHVACPPMFRVPGLVGFRKGLPLFEYLVSAWSEHAGESLDESGWREVATKLQKFDGVLGEGFALAVKDHFDPPPLPPPGPLEVHVAQALAPVFAADPAGRSWAEGMGLGMRREARRTATDAYVKTFLAKKGTLPEGMHRICVEREPRGWFDLLFPPAPPDFVPRGPKTKRKPLPAAANLTGDLKQLEALLEDVTEWKPASKVALKALHAKAREESRLPKYARKLGPYVTLERKLFGDAIQLMSRDDEQGLGFSASLMDGPSVGYFSVAGLESTDDSDKRVWGQHNWQSVLAECPAAEAIEVGEQDDIPGMSDVFYWVSVSDADEYARQLREFIVGLL